MRNNKGYTLVELLVAVAILLIVMAEVGALMFNSQSLYKNGFYEVQVQEESQQVIQQVEDLLMNATGWTRDDQNHTGAIELTTATHNGIKSDVITIYTMVPNIPTGSTNGIPDGTYSKVRYRIGLAFDVNNGGNLPGGGAVRSDADYGSKDHMFETLVLERTPVTAETTPGSYTLGTSTYSTLAEGVKAIHLDYDSTDGIIKGYAEADRVIFSVEMQNMKYSYSTETSSVSVYLRNQPQTADAKPTGTNVGPTGGGSPEDKIIYILRVHPYDLSKYVSSYYDSFEFASPSGSTVYSLSGSHVQLKNSYWGNWSYQNVTTGGVDIYAYNAADRANHIDNRLKITLYTEAVQYNDGLLYTYNNTSCATGNELISVFPVKGICVCTSCTHSHALEPQLYMEKFGPAASGASAIEFSDNFGLKDDAGVSLTSIPIPSAPASPTAAVTPFIDNYCMSKGLTGSSRNDSVSTVEIPFDGGNLSYQSLEWIGGAGPRVDTNGYVIRAHHSVISGSGGTYNFGNRLYFSYKPNIKNASGNAIYLTTSQPFNDSSAQVYWNNIVDNCKGYVRVKMTITWTGVSQAMVINGYLYPECDSVTKDQQDIILNKLAGAIGGAGTPYTPTAAPSLTGTPTTTPGTTPETTPGTTPETTPETTPGTTTTTTPAAETLSGGGAVFNDYHMGNGACNITLTYSGEGTDTSARPVTVVVDFGTAIESSSDSDVTISGSQATVTKSIQYNKYTVGGISFAVKMPEGYSGTPIIVSVTPN